MRWSLTVAPGHIVEVLEERLLAQLGDAATRLQRQYPRLRIHTWSSPVGSGTEYQGHDVGIDCVNPAASEAEPGNLALSLGVMHLTTEPMLCTADVRWGQGGPDGGLDLLPEPVPWSLQALHALEARLPELLESLERELGVLDRMGRRGA